MFISFLFDQNGYPLAGGRARVKLKLKANRRKSNIEPQNVEGRMALRFI